MKDWHTIKAEKDEREIHNILNNILLDNKLSQRRKHKLLSKKQMVVAKNFDGHMINSGSPNLALSSSHESFLRLSL